MIALCSSPAALPTWASSCTGDFDFWSSNQTAHTETWGLNLQRYHRVCTSASSTCCHPSLCQAGSRDLKRSAHARLPASAYMLASMHGQNHNRLTMPEHCRFNARTWVYPAGVPERAYQLDIIRTALLCNTLVCLPTGLGKTLIAAVVMHNFTRWFPQVG